MDLLVFQDGIKIGDAVYTRATIRPLQAGEAIDAAIAGEKVRLDLNGEPVIVSSPMLVSAERLRRQIKQLETEDGATLQGPLSIGDLRRMSEGDYRRLIEHSNMIDALYLARENPKSGGRETAGAGTDTDGSGA